MAIREILLTAHDFNENGNPDAVVIEFRHDIEFQPDYSTIAVDRDEDGHTVLRLEADLDQGGSADEDEQRVLISLADNFLAVYSRQKGNRE